MKAIPSFVAGFMLAIILLASSSIHAQSTPSDYLGKAEAQILAMSRASNSEAGDTLEKRLEAYKAAQKFFSETKPAKGFAAFHSQGRFAANYCIPAMQASIGAKKSKDEKNIFAAGILLQINSGCAFGTQDALVLWLQAKGD